MIPEFIKRRILEWHNVLDWFAGMVTLIVIAAAFSFLVVDKGSAGHEYWHQIFALTVAIAFMVFAFVIVFFFFFVFRGVKADEKALDLVITYCYAFIAFSLSASILPFVILHHVPAVEEMMRTSAIGIVKGCIVPPDEAKRDSVPIELRCGSNTLQWVVNIGGVDGGVIHTSQNQTAAKCNDGSESSEKCIETNRKLMRASLTADTTAAAQSSNDTTDEPLSIQGGLVVPLYVVVLALMGATVSMTRRVPEFQRRLSPGDPEFMTYDQAREAMVFLIMQVASAPLIAVTSYYVIEPNSRASTIVLAFASGFSSETILLFIRAFLEKIRPTIVPAVQAKSTSLRVSPARLDFGDVLVGTSSIKTIGITNPSAIDLAITSVNCTGEFTEKTVVPITLAAGTSITVEVQFTPASVGSKVGVLTISGNAPGTTRAIDLTGTGIESKSPSSSEMQPIAVTTDSSNSGKTAMEAADMTQKSEVIK